MSENDLVKQITDLVILELGKDQMTLQQAKHFILRAEEKATQLAIPMVISVVDEGGYLVAQHRMDGALLASIEIAQAKAFTALSLRTTTAAAAKLIQPGQLYFGLQQMYPGKFCLLGGGIPIVKQKKYIGGIGVSGGSIEQDISVAEFAVSNE